MCSNSVSQRTRRINPESKQKLRIQASARKPENSDAGELPCRARVEQKRGNPIILPLCEVGFTTSPAGRCD